MRFTSGVPAPEVFILSALWNIEVLPDVFEAGRSRRGTEEESGCIESLS
jgi:hypothetical protein